MKNKIVEKILLETESGYDLIADKFSQTRKNFWATLDFIKEYVKDGDNVLDFGCGNGRLLELFFDKKINYTGVDVSGKLIEIARGKYQTDKRHFQKINPSQTSLALEAGFFNTVYSIAVFHHFPSKKYREDVAKELFRVTKDGGYIVVTVWYLWQRKYLPNIFQNWKEKVFRVNNLDWNDCLISFTNNQGEKFQRFHHAFTKRELKNLFETAGFEVEKCEVVDRRNLLYIGKKKS